MNIYGLRIYPQSVEVIRGQGSPIYVHSSVDEQYSDFFYIFRSFTPVLSGHLVANDFPVTYGENGMEDPIPGLKERYGSAFVCADIDSQIVLLQGDDFLNWGRAAHFCEGAFLPVFRKPPGFSLLKRLFWGRDFRLNSAAWPASMRALLHMWDDMYWQLFTRERSDMDLLIQAHARDPRLKMYFVDLDREFPDPSNETLRPATVDREKR